jgi:pimeloyl-ACP methyl ester carboxylesterase
MPMTRTSSLRARGRRGGWATALVVSVALVVAGCTHTHETKPTPVSPHPQATAAPTTPDALAKFYDQKLDWKKCDQGECATLQVPLDYADPTGQTIGLAMARQTATGSTRIGSLLLNPGGPGVSGVSFLPDIKPYISESVRKAYDLVSFDPRGVQRSAPVDCVDAPQLDQLLATDYDYSTDAGVQSAINAWGQFAKGCQNRMGAELGHIDTQTTARDMDVMRAVLGDDALTYLGFSYGTDLGATYAAMFPGRVGRMVLDGPLPPNLPADDLAVGQAQGFEQELRAYVQDCQGGKSCPLTGDVQHGLDQIQGLLDHARANPLPTGTSRRLTASLAFTGIAQALYAPSFWSALTTALRNAIEHGNGNVLLQLADLYSDRQSDGTYATNTMQAFTAISCADDHGNSDLTAMRAQAAEIAKVAPTVGTYFSYSAAACAQWPVPAATPLPSYSAKGAAPILVVGTTGDPATPYDWAQKMAALLDSAELLTYVGNGHTAYGRSNACVQGAVDTYLLQGTMPASGTRC